jgi:hypothetical protein
MVDTVRTKVSREVSNLRLGESLRDVVVTTPTDGQSLVYQAGSWVNGTAASGGSPGGSDKQVQYNDNGAFGGTSGMWWDDPAGSLRLGYEGDSGYAGILSGPPIPPNGTGANTSGLWLIGNAPPTSLPIAGSSGGPVLIRGGEPKFAGNYASGSFGGDIDIRAGIGGAGGTGGSVIINAAGTTTGTGMAGTITLATSLVQWGTNGFTINGRGALGIGAGASPSYGTSGQVLQSTGSSTPPVWATPAGGSSSLTSTYIGYGSGSNTLTGSSGFTWNSGTTTLQMTDMSGYGNPAQITSGGSSELWFGTPAGKFTYKNLGAPSSPARLYSPSTMELQSGDGYFTFLDAGYNIGVTLRGNGYVDIISTSSEVRIQGNPAGSVTSTVPTTMTSVGRLGQMATDGSHLYVCIGPNQWRRVALSTF